MANEYPVAGLGNFSSINLLGVTAGWLQFTVPATVTSYQLQWPSAQGAAGQQLQNNGAGVLSWADAAGGAVTTMGAFGSTPNANGGSIASNTLTLQPASVSLPGGVTAGAQTFGGVKTMSAATAATGACFVVKPTDHANYDSAIGLFNDGTANRKNWLFATSRSLVNVLEITPSTANNGTTFTTPVLTISTAGDLRVIGSLGVGNSAAGSSLGTVVKKIEVFSGAGVSLGFVAVYDAIT